MADSDARLADFLANPRETPEVELKQWLDLSKPENRGKIARHLMALANYGGGWLQFGFVQHIGTLEPLRRFHSSGPSQQENAHSQMTIKAEVISGALAELVRKATEPLFVQFDFFEMRIRGNRTRARSHARSKR